MYSDIKELAEEALKLQNKNFMDETFKKIIAICNETTLDAIEPGAFKWSPVYGQATCGNSDAQQLPELTVLSAEVSLVQPESGQYFDTDQGVHVDAKTGEPSGFLQAHVAAVAAEPLEAGDPVVIDYNAPTENPVVLDEQSAVSILGPRNAEADAIVTNAVMAAAGAYCETGDDKPRAPRGAKKGGAK